MKRNDSPASTPTDDPDEIDRAVIELLKKEPLYFESTRTLDEIEANFKNMNVGDQIIEALNEVLHNIRKQKGSQ